MQWLVVLPLEIIAASITLTYWNESIDKAVFVTVFLVFVVIINFFGVKGYGEAEFVFAIIKVIAVIGFMSVFLLCSVLFPPPFVMPLGKPDNITDVPPLARIRLLACSGSSSTSGVSPAEGT